MVDGIVNIYEEHKYLPWKFNKNGDYIRYATFLDIFGGDTDFLSSTYGITSKEEIAEINDYRRQKEKQNQK